MAIEIERRFLVADPGALDDDRGVRIEQGYLPVDPPSSVRVRLRDGDAPDPANAEAFLTIKHGRSALERLEFEYPIPLADAEVMLTDLCGPRRVRKRRAIVVHGEDRWEVDRFEGDNAPLVLAEIELPAADAPFETPPWLGPEVTDDHRLANSALCERPLASWPAAERNALLALAGGPSPSGATS